MDNKGNSIPLAVLGFLCIIVGIVVAYLTVTGFMDQALHFEFLPAFKGYIIGAVIAILFFVIGVLILLFALRN